MTWNLYTPNTPLHHYVFFRKKVCVQRKRKMATYLWHLTFKSPAPWSQTMNGNMSWYFHGNILTYAIPGFWIFFIRKHVFMCLTCWSDWNIGQPLGPVFFLGGGEETGENGSTGNLRSLWLNQTDQTQGSYLVACPRDPLNSMRKSGPSKHLWIVFAWSNLEIPENFQGKSKLVNNINLAR